MAPKNAHDPGSQGHDPAMLRRIGELEKEHNDMMGNLASDTQPEDATDDFSDDQAGKLYRQQAPKDWKSRRTNKGSKLKPVTYMKRGDESGNY